jgi:hypothetical protein
MMNKLLRTPTEMVASSTFKSEFVSAADTADNETAEIK